MVTMNHKHGRADVVVGIFVVDVLEAAGMRATTHKIVSLQHTTHSKQTKVTMFDPVIDIIKS